MGGARPSLQSSTEGQIWSAVYCRAFALFFLLPKLLENTSESILRVVKLKVKRWVGLGVL